MSVYAVDEAVDVGCAEHVGDDEDDQKQRDDANNTGTCGCFIQLAVELGKLGGGQAVDALFNLVLGYTQAGR